MVLISNVNFSVIQRDEFEFGGVLKMNDSRKNDEIKITYKRMEKNDIPELTSIMKAAFDVDTKMHTNLEEDGPNGYDNGGLLKKLMNLQNAVSEVIYVDDTMVGGYTIIKDKDIYTLDMLFVSPSCSSKGIGHKVWKDIEKTYTGAKTWLLETPDYSKRNHYFYEKCGFKKSKEHSFEDGSKSFVFIKHTKNYPIEIREYQEQKDYVHILNSCKNEHWEKFYTSKKDIYTQALKNSITYVAYEEDSYCGYIRCITDGVFTIYCCEIIVDDEYKRKGIGRLLIEKVRTEYPTCCMDVLSDNDEFYQANNFQLLCNGMRKVSPNSK